MKGHLVKLGCLALCLICSVPGTALAKEKVKSATIEIKAKSLEAHQKRRRVTFSGDVRVRRGPLTLRCDALVSEYSETGEIMTLEATGNLQIIGKNFTATAESATYIREKTILILSGSPAVMQGRSKLTGKTVTIWLDEERVSISEAKGVFDPASISIPVSR